MYKYVCGNTQYQPWGSPVKLRFAKISLRGSLIHDSITWQCDRDIPKCLPKKRSWLELEPVHIAKIFLWTHNCSFDFWNLIGILTNCWNLPKNLWGEILLHLIGVFNTFFKTCQNLCGDLLLHLQWTAILVTIKIPSIAAVHLVLQLHFWIQFQKFNLSDGESTHKF